MSVVLFICFYTCLYYYLIYNFKTVTTNLIPNVNKTENIQRYNYHTHTDRDKG